MKIFVWVGLGSALGGMARYLCSGFVARLFGETFPFGTLFVNVLGSFLIALFVTLAGPEGRLLVDPHIRQFVVLGLFGGFTTFSSFSLQTLVLIQEGEWWQAGLNVLLSVAMCLLAAWLGHALAVELNRPPGNP